MNWPQVLLIVTALLALTLPAVAQGGPPAGIEDDLPIGPPVEPGTISPADGAEATEASDPVEPTDDAEETAEPGEPMAAATPPDSPTPPPDSAAPSMAYTGFNAPLWFGGASALILLGLCLVVLSRRLGRSGAGSPGAIR